MTTQALRARMGWNRNASIVLGGDIKKKETTKGCLPQSDTEFHGETRVKSAGISTPLTGEEHPFLTGDDDH